MISDIEYIIEQFENLTDSKVVLEPAQWARENRVLPRGLTPKPGPWSDDATPYVTEPLNHVSSASNVREVVIVKGAQTAFTVSVLENAIGYSIGEDPCPMQYVTADNNLAGARMEVAINRMIDTAGLRSKIFSQSEDKTGRNSGNTLKKKEFPGGFLIASSIGSASSGRSFSIQRLFLDEIDAAKDELGKDGDPIAVFVTRTDAFESTKKIYYVSTPLEKSTSKIYPLFLKGDQRKYFVSCPTCGEMQFLEFSQLHYEEKNGKLVKDSVYYECKNCKAHWLNNDKVELLKSVEKGGKAKWMPTAETKREGLVSYHISSLYAPVGFKSWETICQQWIDAQEAKRNGDISKLRSFINLVLGEPWEERGEAPRYEIIMQGRINYNYHSGRIPNIVQVTNIKGQQMIQEMEPLFITFGADVHGNRIEIEFVAWGKESRSWSYAYYILDGETETSTSSAFDKLRKLISESDFETDAGKQIPVLLGFIDAGYNTEAVYSFCSSMNGVFPVQGQPGKATARWKVPFKQMDVVSHNIVRYDLNVDILKDQVYANLKRSLHDDGTYPSSFCFFPYDYPEKFFRMLCSEEKVWETDKYGNKRAIWKKPTASRRNEFLDCRVYATAALYAYAYDVCINSLKQDGITWSIFWDYVSYNFTRIGN